MEPKRSVADRLFSVEGKTVLVTGASSGIGRELSLLFAEGGANVVVSARRKDRLDALVEDIAKLSAGQAKVVQMDVSGTEESIDAAVEQAWSAFGRIDILVNNAGIAAYGSLQHASVDQYEQMFGVNVRGVWLVARAVTKRQVADGKGGVVLNVSSLVSEITTRGVPLYSASKSAVTTLTKHMARELGSKGIRVNAIVPGMFPSEINQRLMSTDACKEALKKIPIGRPGDTTRELHGAVLLLTSDAGSYITGTTITVDGGASLVCLDFV